MSVTALTRALFNSVFNCKGDVLFLSTSLLIYIQLKGLVTLKNTYHYKAALQKFQCYNEEVSCYQLEVTVKVMSILIMSR